MGLSSDPQGHMSLDEPGLDALFRIWATSGSALPGARPGLARTPLAAAVVTAQDTVRASS